MSPTEFFLPLALVIVIPFLLRRYRDAGMMSFVLIDNEFRSFRQGKFVAANVIVLFSDKRIDHFAPSTFTDSRMPAVAIYICSDRRLRKYWLWKLYRPTEPDPSLRELTPHEANAMLQRKGQLLAELCPKQRGFVSSRPSAEKSRTRSFWDQ